MYLGLRVLAGALWAAALALVVGGSVAIHTDVKLDLYAWCMIMSFAGATLSVWLIVEHVVEREADRNARITADAVAEALRVLNDEGSLRAVPTPTRRGT